QDFCILSGGLSFSETLKMVLLGIIAQNDMEEEDLNQLNAADLAAVKHAALLDKINIALHEKAFGRANKLVKQLPNELEGNKMLLLQQLNMGYHFKNKLLPQTLQIYEQTFPHDAAARFSLLKLSIEQGDNISIEKYAQDFAQLLPDAGYLNVLRTQALYNLGQEQQAASIIGEMMLSTPNDTDVCKAIMVYLLNEERFADVVNLLEQMQGNNNIDPIKLVPAHAGFLNSETYKEWIEGVSNPKAGSKP
ncbi:MAG TPA: hypothetical protein PK715_11915, partial [Chitinophagales bacterium]|nr:hypothetical protein [Chitinophagales bacterium]